MPLTSAQLVRARITDTPRYFDSAYSGNGIDTRTVLGDFAFTSGTAYVQPGGTAWSATGATFNVSGYVDFATPISANSAYRVVGTYTIFPDDLIDEYLSGAGSVVGAALECAYTLMFDASKRARWMSPDGSQHDDIGSITALRAVIDDLKKEQEREAIHGGGFQSWAENQGDYP